MDVKKKFRLLICMRNIVLWATGLCYSFTLLRLGIANAQVIRTYQRSIRRHSRRSIIRIFGDVLLTIGQYAQLFKTFPIPETIEDEYEQQRLIKIYQSARDICSSHTLKTDPLTAPSAIKIQAAVMKCVFQRFFGLMLTEAESEILGRYGSVNMAIKDFLKRCGYGNDSPFVSLLLPLQLPSFVVWSELRHSESTSRQNFLRMLIKKTILLKEAGLLGRIKAVRFWAQHYTCRIYWNHEDKRDRITRLVYQKQAYEDIYREIFSLKREMITASQNSVLTVLAYEMYSQAITVLFNIRSESNAASQDFLQQGKYRHKQDQLFRQTIQRLGYNLKSLHEN